MGSKVTKAAAYRLFATSDLFSSAAMVLPDLVGD
jgi:hypothetical protein